MPNETFREIGQRNFLLKIPYKINLFWPVTMENKYLILLKTDLLKARDNGPCRRSLILNVYLFVRPSVWWSISLSVSLSVILNSKSTLH